MIRPKRKWTAPLDEAPAPTAIHRPASIWREPLQEEEAPQPLRPYRLLQAKPKVKITHSVEPQLHQPLYQDSRCSFPRFKKIRPQNPEKSNEKVLQLQKKNSNTWIDILSYLHRYSLLFQKTADSKYQDAHISNIIMNYNQVSVARHLQIWQHFTDWCQPFGFHPANISTSFLLDFIYEATHQIQCQTYNMKSLIQSLKFVAHHAEVQKLTEVLNAPVINGYISSTKKPQNPREVYPLPFHVAVSFEYYIMDERRPQSSRFILGRYLFMFWTGLRFQDLQRTPPSSVTLTDGIIRAICELSKTGIPQPAACLACGFGSYSFSSGWGYAWFDLLTTWLRYLHRSAPDFKMDFVFPEVYGEGAIETFLVPKPMLYCKAASILRHVAKQPFMSPPYNSSEVATLTVHSTKSALISAAKQLDLPTHWIAEQGHHRGKRTQGDRYSRDDTVYQLLLQKTASGVGDQLPHKLEVDSILSHRNTLLSLQVISNGQLFWKCRKIPAYILCLSIQQNNLMIRHLYYLYRMEILHLRRQFLRPLFRAQILSRTLHHLPHQKMNSRNIGQDLSF